MRKFVIHFNTQTLWNQFQGFYLQELQESINTVQSNTLQAVPWQFSHTDDLPDLHVLDYCCKQGRMLWLFQELYSSRVVTSYLGFPGLGSKKEAKQR